MTEINKLEWFVGMYFDKYREATGEPSQVKPEVIAALGSVIIDMLDQRDQDNGVITRLPTFQNHYHPQSDQILRAVGNMVTIESRDDAIARQQSVRWEHSRDTNPRPDHYEFKDVEVTTTISHPDGCCMGRAPRSQGT